MSKNFKDIEQRMIRREILRRQGKALKEDIDYEFREAMGLLSMDFPQRPPEPPPVAPTKSPKWLVDALSSIRDGWAKNRVGLGRRTFASIAVVLLLVGFLPGFFVGRQRAPSLESGAKGGQPQEYGVPTIENLLTPPANDIAALDATSRLLEQYLATHPDDHWFRVRLIQIDMGRRRLATKPQEQVKLDAAIKGLREQLPRNLNLDFNKLPYEGK